MTKSHPRCDPCHTLVMKFVWHNTILNLAAWNSDEIEEINTLEYTTLLGNDNWQANFDGDNDDLQVMDIETF